MNSLSFDKDLRDISFVVVDTETTGLYHQYDDTIIEIAAVTIDPGFKINLNNSYNTLIHTHTKIKQKAYETHKISQDMLRGAPSLKNVMNNFYNFINDKIFVAHNVRFDYGFIKKAYDDCELPNNIHYTLDTMVLSRKINRSLKSHSLDSLISYYDIEVPELDLERHRALYDATQTSVILLKMLYDLYNQGKTTLGCLHKLISNK